jgi:urease accessory protein
MSKMLRFTEVVGRQGGKLAPDGDGGSGTPALLTLGFEERRRSRMRIRIDDGREAALLLPRGTVLRDGDRLRDPDRDELVSVRAADQTLSLVRAADPVTLARAAYHLGNRHVPVQVGAGWLAYEHDHVLDDMVAELGLAVETRVAPFEPEAGGYRHGENGGGHGHEHGHEHGQGHGHGHDH